MKFSDLKSIQEALRLTGNHKHTIEFYKDGKDMNKPTETYALTTFSAAVFLANNLQRNYTATESDGKIICKAKKPKKHIFIIK